MSSLHTVVDPVIVAVGSGLTVTSVDTEFTQPLLLVTVRVYSPSIARVAEFDTTGLCWSEIKPSGPVHE